jgi:hypothetical protein
MSNTAKTAVAFLVGVSVLVLIAVANSGPPPAPLTPEQQAERAAKDAKKAAEDAERAAKQQAEDAAKDAERAAKDACYKDWHACADNAMLANSGNATYRHAKIACKMVAEERARFGTPKWPWFAFGSFYKGDNYITTGKAVLVEPDAQFQTLSARWSTPGSSALMT